MSFVPHDFSKTRASRPATATLAGLAPGPRNMALLGLVLVLALPLAQAHLLPQSAVTARVVTAGLLALILSAIVALLARHGPTARLGAANGVTATRAAMVALLATALFGDTPPPPGWSLVAVAILALALDGIDGWLARRQGLATAFGARFDMETDSALALVLAALAAERLGVWVLALGVARYLFLFAMMLWPWLSRPLPESPARKAICVWQIGVLIALQVPWLPGPAAAALAVATALALLWSFARDALWLAARRP